MASRRNKIIIGVVVGFGVLGVIGAIASPSEDQESSDKAATVESSPESVADTATEVADTTSATVPAATAPPTTAKQTTTTGPLTTTTTVQVTTTVKATTTTAKVTESTTNLNIAGGNDPEDFLMPNVVCMNLQEAQDEIQDHGVFYSRSEDATGQGRMQIMDSNWIVIGQKPAVGTKIGEGDAVLSVVKIGESTRGIC